MISSIVSVRSGSAIASASRGLVTAISMATTRPWPSARGTSRWQTTPRSEAASARRTCFCSCGGKKSMMRFTVSLASVVCSVDITKWPVSAADRRGLDGLGVAHLADQDDVGVLAHRRAQRGRPVGGVGAELALVDRGLLVVVDDLDRVLDGEDVHRALLVHGVHHGRERRRLAGAGRAGDQHQAAGLEREPADHVGHVEVLERLRARRRPAASRSRPSRGSGTR